MGISTKRVCLVPSVSGVGGMVSFRARLMKGLAERGVSVSTDLADTPYSSVLVIGGTRDLPGLWRTKRRGVRIIQRLDGMNWIHRERRTGWRHYLRAEYGNFILSQIRSHLADSIIYQSQFSHDWWTRVYGVDRTPWKVVYNGVDLSHYTPTGPGQIPQDRSRILLVEGSISGGYEWGLETAIQLVQAINSAYRHNIELQVVGRVSDSLQQHWTAKSGINLSFTGLVPGDRVPELDRSAHLLYAADVNAACPNSVIEALGCGLPVVAFDTGALSELVKGEAGRIVPYGGNPWKLDPPDIKGLSEAAQVVISHQDEFRAAARARAETAFGLDQMVEGYLGVMDL